MCNYKFPFLVASLIAVFSLTATAQSPEPDKPAATTPVKPPTRISAAEQQKKLLKRVEPVYTKEAFDAKLTGIVSLETTIGLDGKVTGVRPLGNANALLVKAAEDAVRQWVYMPTVINKVRVEVVTIVSINFKVGE